jgi:FkbM family methyltransferase
MAKWWARPRFDVVELALMLAFVGLVVWGATLPRPPVPPAEAARLYAAYGPSHFSQNAEEWIIRDFFQDRRDGFFVDVGANHYKTDSNTYYLEATLGWRGIAVEPLASFAPDYATHRPRTVFRPFFVSNVSNETATMYVLDENSVVSSSSREFTERHGHGAKPLEAMTITLNDLLDAERVREIDLLSMDIELAEPKALAGFDIRRFAPELVCIEAHPEVVQALLDYFSRHGYVVVGKYLRVDAFNLYFMPAKPAPEGGS